MDNLNTFTSTGIKLIHHPLAIKRVMDERMGTPISIQLAPTSRCNLNCVFCSNANRTNHEDLNIEDLKALILNMGSKGTKTIEITGGGDPTMYRQINELIDFCASLSFKMGMITNGVALRTNVTKTMLDKLTWLRISMNCLDYVDGVDIPTNLPGTLGFSYVMNDKTTDATLDMLRLYTREYNPAYVRIVPNCQCTDEQQRRNNKIFGEVVEAWGPPFFYQPKLFRKPRNCYWGYFKPFILHDGWVYPCSSVVLNTTSDRSFHSKYRWMRMEDLPHACEKQMFPYPDEDCDHCVFCDQNNLVDSILNPCGMEDFV